MPLLKVPAKVLVKIQADLNLTLRAFQGFSNTVNRYLVKGKEFFLDIYSN